MPDSFNEYKRRMEAEGYHIAMQPIQLTPGRFPLPTPYPNSWSIERQLIEAVREGNLLLEAEAKEGKPAPSSVKPDAKTAVEDALASKSDNPYVRARAQILSKLDPHIRSLIEHFETLSSELRAKQSFNQRTRYDTFCKQVTELGDKLSNNPT
jgi:hypothetical protein